MVVCITGIVTTIISLIIIVGSQQYVFSYLDHLINTVLFYCLFDFGDPLYHWLFDGSLRRVQRMCGRDDPLIDHHKSEHQMVQSISLYAPPPTKTQMASL